MSRTSQVALVGAGLNGLVAVVAGALGAHAVPAGEAEEVGRIVGIASTFQLVHAALLVGIAALARIAPIGVMNFAAWCFALGAFVFAGALYTTALHGPAWIGSLAPAGGFLMIIGWGMVLAAGFLVGRRGMQGERS